MVRPTSLCPAVAVAVSLLAGPLSAAVTLERVTPLALRPGQVTTLVCRGTQLDTATTLWTSFPATVKKIAGKGDGPRQATFEVRLPAGSIGPGGVRVVTSRGLSNLKLILRDDLPGIAAIGRPGSKPLGFALAVDGQGLVGPPASVSIRLVAGQRLTVDLWARRLGSSLDPVVRIIGPDGQGLAAVDDTPGLHGDARVSIVAAAAGHHSVTVTDVRQRGGEAYFYHLRLGAFPAVGGTYPLFVQRGIPASVQLLGPAQDTTTVKFSPPRDGGRPTWWLAAAAEGMAGSALVPVGIVEGKVDVEHEPNDTPPAGGARSLPTTGLWELSGRLAAPGDRDWYRLSVKQGQRLRVVGMTQSLGLPGLLYMRLCDSGGKTLQVAVQDSRPDRVIEHTAAADGELLLLVEELQRRGGPGYAYHLRLGLARPGFDLAVSTDRLHAAPGGKLSLKVTVTRRDFNGAISLSVEGLGDEVGLTGQQIVAGKKQTMLTITLPKTLLPGQLKRLKIRGSGEIGPLTEGIAVKELQSVKFDRGNLGIFDGFISDNKGGLNFAEYDLELAEGGEYLVLLKYAAKSARPATMKLNGKAVKLGIMSQTTGSWDPGTAKWFNEGLVKFPAGKSVLRLEKTGVFSHLTTIRIALPAKPDPTRRVHQATASTAAVLRKELAGMRFVPRGLTDTVLLSVGKAE